MNLHEGLKVDLYCYLEMDSGNLCMIKIRGNFSLSDQLTCDAHEKHHFWSIAGNSNSNSTLIYTAQLSSITLFKCALQYKYTCENK